MNGTFPIPKEQFITSLATFLTTDAGSDYQSDVGLDAGRVQWAQVQ
jgi:hypothetical protein